MDNKYLYSVLCYNIHNYEVLHEIEKSAYDAMKDKVEFVYVTDDKSITSSTWTIKYVDWYDGDVFVPCYNIRFNPFDYVSSDIVIRIDGSMQIVKDLQPLIDRFNEGNYDLGIIVHPTRQTQYEEYCAWVYQRGMKPESANNVLSFMQNNGYDVKNYKGLYQFNFMIHRKNQINLDFMKETYDVLKLLAIDGEEIHRCDQTVGSFVLNAHYPSMKILPFGQYICFDHYFRWCAHNTDTQMVYNNANDVEPYIGNRSVTVYYV